MCKKIIGTVLMFFLSEMVLALDSELIYYCVTDDQSEFLAAHKNFIDTLEYKGKSQGFIPDLNYFIKRTHPFAHTKTEASQKQFSQLGIPTPAECTAYFIGVSDAACSMCAVDHVFYYYKTEHSIDWEQGAVNQAYPSPWYVAQIPGWFRVVMPAVDYALDTLDKAGEQAIMRGIPGGVSLLFTVYVLKQLELKIHWNLAAAVGTYCAIAPGQCVGFVLYAIGYE